MSAIVWKMFECIFLLILSHFLNFWMDYYDRKSIFFDICQKKYQKNAFLGLFETITKFAESGPQKNM